MQKPVKTLSSFSVILTFVFFSLAGIALLPFIPVKLSPSELLPKISVSYRLPGNSPLVVEKEITAKLEALLSRVKGIKRISSTSGNGWGRINVHLDNYVKPQAARFEIASVIRQAWPDMPEGASYPEIRAQSSSDDNQPASMSFTITAPAPPAVIQQYMEDHVSNRLSQTEGVERIQVYGANPMEWHLEYDYNQLKTTGITVGDIQSALKLYTSREAIGMAQLAKTGNSESYVRLVLGDKSETEDTEDFLKNIELKNRNGRVIKLGDIATIYRTEAAPTGYYRINGRNTINMTIVATDAVNQLQLSDRIKNELKKISKELPEGYHIQTAYDAADYLREELKKVYYRTGLTIALLFLFVWLAYRRFKFVLLTAIALVATIAISFIFYYLSGVEIQLYSMAGITISLTLIIDNVIVLADQLIQRRKMDTFPAILAATLTTVASLVIIFFLDEKTRLNLTDFARVIMINLSVSLLTTLFLVPALVEKMITPSPVLRKRRAFRLFSMAVFKKSGHHRWLVYFNRFYSAQCRILYKGRIVVFIAMLLLLGLPVFLLPDKIEKKGWWPELYNSIAENESFRQDIRPLLEKTLGGTWRLFVQEVYEGSYINDKREETMLYVNATLPNGSTLSQMNHLMQQMEKYLTQFKQVRQFETTIYNANRASISIRFGRKDQLSGFPFQLKSDLISKSLELGGGSWSVYGVGDGFSNDLKENAGSYRATLYGYNYDDLYQLAVTFKNELLKYRRIKEVSINSEYSWFKNDYQEFGFILDKEKTSRNRIENNDVFNTLKQVFARENTIGVVFNKGNYESVKLNTVQSVTMNTWDLNNYGFRFGSTPSKVSEMATVEKSQQPQEIEKENQQYILCVQYEYIGAYEQGQRVHADAVKAFRATLPVGYSITNENEKNFTWKEESKNQYWLLGIVFLIIFFCSSILFNSLKQALYIVFIIPVSFIGIFLSFYWFDLNFDQGGFASFVLLSGLVVNTNIYFIHTYNSFIKTTRYNSTRAYIKAWNEKFRPAALTIISTILGFVPFLTGYREAFWFPLAAGTIGGLVFSFVAIYLILPLLIIKRE